MAVQNMYNNYLKRQKQNSTNQFRQKVANSLSGKTVGNNTTQNKTGSMMGNTGVNTLGSGVQIKPITNVNSGVQIKPQQNIQRTITQPTPQATTTPSNVNTTQTQPITPVTSQNALQSSVEPSTAISEQQITPQATPEQTLTPSITPNQETAPGVGMMSLSDINNAFNEGEQTSQPTNTTLTQEDMAYVEKLANTPSVIRMARASNKTPQQLALESLNTQKEAFQKQWEQQKAELELQKKQLQETYKTSVTDADNAYKESEKTLQENRYNQQEDLAVSGQKRGIQYSPQQLALENVANISLNKSLAEASKTRNELLNQLQIQLSQSLANVVMGLQNATVEYNANVSNLMANYQDKLADWSYSDDQTKKDQAFQKEMAELQNKWQAEQNALDRKTYGKSSGGSGYSYSRSYTPYSSSGNYSKSTARTYTPYDNDLDLSTDEGTEAYLGTVKQYSTDLYNALKSDPLYDVNERGQIYIDEIDKYIDYAKENGASSEVINELQKTRQVATKHLFRDSYAKKTNSTIKKGDTYYKSTTPVKKEYVNKVKKDRVLDASKYNSIVGRTNLERNASKNLANTIKGVNKGIIKKTTTKSSSKTKVGANRDFVYTPKKSTNTSKKTNFKQSEINKRTTKKVSTSIKNVSTAKKKVQATTNKKASQNNKAKTQSKFQKSLSNLKKNIVNLFSKKKK